MIVVDAEGKSLAEFSTLIKPQGWKVSEFNLEHGITQEDCEKYGMKISSAFRLYLLWASMVQEQFAYNIGFDRTLMAIEAARLGVEMPFVDWFCPMLAMTDVCKIPKPSGKPGYKWPSLAEAYKHATGKDIEGAHDALNDIRATKDVTFWVKALEEEQVTG